jgi:hypothetical protein
MSVLGSGWLKAHFTQVEGWLEHFDLDYHGAPPDWDGDDQHWVNAKAGEKLTLFFGYKEGTSGNDYVVRVYAYWDKYNFIAHSDNGGSAPSEVGREIGGFRWDREDYVVPSNPGIYYFKIVYSASSTAPTWSSYDRLLFEDAYLNVSSEETFSWCGLGWDAHGGTWRADGSELDQTDTSGVCWAFSKSDWTDTWIEVHVKLSGEVAVGFRSTDPNNVYYFCLAGNARLLTLAKIIGGVETCNIMVRDWIPNFNHLYRVEINIIGSRILAYLDGTLIFDHTALDLPVSGRVGIRTYFSAASFSHVVVGPALTYPSDRWERFWYVNNGPVDNENYSIGLYAGADSSQTSLILDTNWGYSTLAYDRSDHIGFISSRTVVCGGRLLFTVGADDGCRLYVDDELVINEWHWNPYSTYTYESTLSSGNHTLRLEYFENDGAARMSFNLEQRTDPRVFVSNCYLDLLFRNPEPEGLEYWTGELESGRLTQAGLVEATFNSREYQNLWRNRLFVALMYDGVFERVPDQGGYDCYVTALDSSALTREQMLDIWLGSPEWNARFGRLDNAEFVTKLYRGMLHREPEQEGLSHWESQLNEGKTRSEVIMLFRDCAEYRSVNSEETLVYQIYLGLLRRMPETEGYRYWLGELHSGSPRQKLINAFLASPEYIGIH